MQSQLVAPPPVLGEWRTVKHKAFFTWDWDTPQHRIPFRAILQRYIGNMEKDGWKFEKLVRLDEVPTPLVDEKGNLVQEWLVLTLFSRKVQQFRVQVPDSVVPALLENPKIRLN